MTNDEIEKIIKSFSNTLLQANKFSLYLCAVWYPESLLEYPKEKIKKAIDIALISHNLKGDIETAELLKASLVYLDNFIDDEEAYIRNHRIMGRKTYWEEINKQN